MSSDKPDKPEPRESTQLLVAGLGIGTLGVVGAVVGAAVCPICVVATPALLGAGLYKRWREGPGSKVQGPGPGASKT